MSEIVDLLKQSLVANPADWNVRKAVVEQLVKDGDLQGCAEIIRECPGSPPDPETALRFSELVRGSDSETALRLIDGGLSSNASDGSLHFAKAEILLQTGNIAEAGTHYSVAKTFDSSLQSVEFEKRLGEAAIGATAVASAPLSAGVEEVPEPQQPEVSESVAESKHSQEAMAAGPEHIEPEEVPQEFSEAMVVPEFPVEHTEQAVVHQAVEAPVEEHQVFHEAEPELEEVHEVATEVGADYAPEAEHAGAVVPEVESLHHIPVEELPALRPLVDPSLVPDAAKLNTGHVHVAAPAINYTPQEELMATRTHLSVFDPSGSVIDADALEDDAWYEDHHEKELMVAEGGYVPLACDRDKTTEKVGAVLTTILVHVGIALLLWVLVISIPEAKPPEIVATTLNPTTEQRVSKKQVARQVQQKPSAPSQNVAQIITAATTANVSAPTVDFAPETDSVELGTSFGIGMGFGSGGSGSGGTFSFMGNSGSGNRVVFAVDYSASMRSGGREALMKEELAKSIARLPRGSQYQVVFFSGFAFPHDAVKDEWLKDKGSWGPRNDTLLKKMKPFGSGGRLKDNADDITVPKYSYLEATPSNIAKSRGIVQEMPLTYGTNWEHPVIMALSIKPKPDIIFFMTDGAVGDPTKAINAITELNKKGKPAQINTTAMMEPKAAGELSTLAKKNGGKFSIVMKDGKVVKGEDYFGKKKKK